jgi:hypothetical protein
VLLEKRAKIESLGCKLWDSLTFEPWLHFATTFCRTVEYLTYYNFYIHTFTFSSLMLVLWLCEYKCPSPWLGFVSHCIVYTTAVDHAGWWLTAYSRFGEALVETSKFITYSYNIQIIHILVRWNPPKNGEKTHKKIFI